MGLIDLLFPKTCVSCGKFGSYICENCVKKIEYLDTQVCSECYKGAIGGQTHPYCQKRYGLDGVISLVNYKSPVREMIQQLKYRFTTNLLDEISQKLVFDQDLVRNRKWTVLPLPLHVSRQNFRGFNQAELLGKIVADKLNLNFDNKTLIKTAKTKPQVGLNKNERKDNVVGVFEITRKLESDAYFIFDDVWTSGASLKSAAEQLKKAGVKTVWGLTLAHPR